MSVELCFFILMIILIEAIYSESCQSTILLIRGMLPLCFEDRIEMIRKVKYCECGCRQEVKNRFVKGHHRRKKKPFIKREYCECGCGQLAKSGNRFITGHNGRCMSKKTRDKIKRSLKGNKRGLGKLHTEKWKRERSLTLKGKPPNNKGIPRSERAIKKQVETVKEGYASGRLVFSEERRKKISKIRCEKIASGEIKLSWKFKDTSIEIAIEEQLKKHNLKYEKQKYIENVGLVDFFLSKYGLIIECDGDYFHNLPGAQQKDIGRDFASEFLYQYKTIRFWEHEIKESSEKCMKKVLKFLKNCKNNTNQNKQKY